MPKIKFNVKCINPDGSCTRSCNTPSLRDAVDAIDYYEKQGFKVEVSETPYEPVRQDAAYWASIYPDGNYPAGI